MRALSDTMPKPVDPRWSDLRTRAASALVLGPLAIFCVWYGGWAWAALLLVAMAGLGGEWGRLAGVRHPYLMGFILGLVWLGAVLGGPLGGLACLGLLWVGVALSWGGFAGYGVPYAGLAGVALLWLRARPNGLADAVFLVLVVWGTDIGAYLAGRLLGGPKLAPRISPGKTWAGSVGGLLIAAVIGAALVAGLGGAWGAAFAAGALLSLVAQAGDLLESAIKRKLGVKDSGRTIPGHGGLFDRLDGFLSAAPVAALLVLCGGVALWR